MYRAAHTISANRKTQNATQTVSEYICALNRYARINTPALPAKSGSGLSFKSYLTNAMPNRISGIRRKKL